MNISKRRQNSNAWPYLEYRKFSSFNIKIYYDFIRKELGLKKACRSFPKEEHLTQFQAWFLSAF